MDVPDRQIQKIVSAFLSTQPLVFDLTNRSFLDEKLKRMYIRSYEERLNRLKRST
jgi:serine/threonine-protein kinase HipA